MSRLAVAKLPDRALMFGRLSQDRRMPKTILLWQRKKETTERGLEGGLEGKRRGGAGGSRRWGQRVTRAVNSLNMETFGSKSFGANWRD